MNLEEIREAARECGYERDEAKPLIILDSPKPVAFDLRGLSKAMAPKLEALAKHLAVSTEKLADALDKAWIDIVAASETVPATGLRGEGASLLLEGMIKVVDGADEASRDDSVDVFARAKEILRVGGFAGSIPGAASEAMEIEKKLAEVAALTGSTVESIKDSVSALARTSSKSRSEALADALAAAGRSRHGDLVAKLLGFDVGSFE